MAGINPGSIDVNTEVFKNKEDCERMARVRYVELVQNNAQVQVTCGLREIK